MANLPNVMNPLESFSKGFHMTDNLMNQILNRQKLKTGHEEFLAQQKQLENHFQANLGLSKAAAGRAAQAAMDAHQAALNKLDPTYEAKQYEALENYFRNRGASPATGGEPVVEQNAAPEEQMQQTNMPTEEAGQGMGMFNPEGLSQIQNSEIERQQQGNQMPQEPLQQIAPTSRQQGMYPGVDLELMKQHPILRAMFKQKYKVDPLAALPQTPEEKQAAQLDLFKQKEAIKAANKKTTANEVPLTTAMKTKLQGVVTGVDNSLPVIEELVKDYKNLPTGTETFNPAAYAAYNAKGNAIIEPLINAFGLNVTDATKEMMHDQVFRKTNESLEKYRNRLVDLAKEIIRRRNDSFSGLKSGTITPKFDLTSDYFDKLKYKSQTIKGKTYYLIDGEWHE